MKWIGTQIIYDHVRLNKGITLDSVSITTIQSSGESFADNDTSLMTSAAILDKIQATATGDITGVTITTDSGGGSAASDTAGSADFSILGASGVGVTNSGTTITAVAVPAEIDHDSLQNFAANEHFTQANITTVGTIGTGVWQGTAILTAYIDAEQTNITALGTIGAGVWQGTAIASAYLDADTAHLSGTQTFTGAKTFSNDTTTFTSATADSPLIKVLNTTDDDQAGRLIFEKLRADDAVAGGQNLGEIWFRGQDNAQNTEDYGYIIGEIDVSTGGQESGKLAFGVAAHDGSNRTAATFTGGSESTEVDATIGLGANSVVTIPGNIDLAGDIDVDGTLETDALTIGGTALTSVCSPVAGHASIVTVGTIGTGTWQGTAIASAYLDADTAHYSATRQVTHHMITDDIDSDVIYISLGEIDSEGTSATGKHLPLIAPTAGKLLKIFLRTSVNYSSETFTWKLYTRNVSASTGGSPSEIGAQSGAGPTNKTMVTYDFTTGLDSGTNAIAAGDKVQISIEAGDGATANGNYFITCMCEWDLS